MGQEQTIAVNRKARHEFSIEETFEAGLVLTGTEIKSVRANKVNLGDAYARVERGEAWLIGANIAPWETGNRYNHEAKRRRKLLLHRAEIRKLIGKTVEKGMTLVPTRMYFRNGFVKVTIALAKGKKAHDKRETVKRREAERETRAAIKERRR